MDYDVAVVGAGPAGSATARDIAAAGFRVLLLEEHQQVGVPLHCSGFVTPRVLQLAGLDSEVVVNTVKGALVHAPGGKTLLLGGDKTRALVLDRVLFDQRLAEAAQVQGTKLSLGSQLVGIERQNAHVELRVQRTGREHRLSTRLLIGADGVRSRVASWLGQPRGETVWALGIEARLPGHPVDMAQVYVGNHLAPGWFGWTIPLSTDRVRIGIGSISGSPLNGNHKPRWLLERLVAHFPSHFRGLEVLGHSGGFIPLYSRVKSYAANVLLVGDAARQVKPTSGGGIYPALLAARYAAETSLLALQREDLSESMLAHYERRWRKRLGRELEQAQRLRNIYARLGNRHLDLLCSVLSSPLLQGVIRRYGDIDFQSKVFSALVKVAPVLRPLVGA
ncbi:MAG: geranylgeranyl reductase family protein [Dehalococcoidia bacterium]